MRHVNGDNLNNVKRKVTGKINNLETNTNNENILDSHTGINEIKKGYQLSGE